MKNNVFIFILVFVTISCKKEIANESVTKTNSEDSISFQSGLITNALVYEGEKELFLSKRKYESNWNTKPKTFPYSKGTFFRVFELSCPNECFRAEFKNRSTKGTEISKTDFNELIKILNTSSSYNNATSACYHPKFGLVVYDSENIPTESMSICLDCNLFDTYPGKIMIEKKQNGFSKEAREKLRNLFFKWGIDYYGYSSFWDDEDDYNRYLEQKTN